MRTKRALLAVFVLALLVGLATPVSSASPTTSVTIDIDDTGPWTGFFRMDPLFFKRDGIRFDAEYMVGFSNGHAVLIGNQAWNTPPYTISASFTRPVTSVSASLRVHLQGTAEYTLIAYSAAGDVLGSRTITLTQNGLDPNFYDITVDNLPSKAKSFSLVGGIDYGVRSVTYEYSE
jgi:hypothetical protein